MNDIKVPPFTEGQKELIKMTEKLANGRKICDVDDIDDDKDIKEMLSETIAKNENQKQNNFQRITASPEALAEFINKAEETYERCCKGDIRCDFCDCQWCGIAGRSELVEWLKQESGKE